MRLYAIILSAISISASAQDINWIKSTWGDDQNFSPMCIDRSGNLLVTGSSYGTLTLDGYSMMGHGFFVAKYDPHGNIIWAKEATAAGAAKAISIDAAGNSYIVGTFYDSVRFGNLSIYGNDWSNVYFAKFDSGGNILWLKGITSGHLTSVWDYEIKSDDSGNFFLGGFYGGDSLNIDNQGMMKVPDTTNTYVAMFDSTGLFKWIQYGITSSYPRIYLHGQSIYVTGEFQHWTKWFGQPYLSNYGCFLMKLDKSGSKNWIIHIDSEQISQITFDSLGNLYCIGSSSSLVLFPDSSFFKKGGAYYKLTSDGLPVWFRFFDGDTGSYNYKFVMNQKDRQLQIYWNENLVDSIQIDTTLYFYPVYLGLVRASVDQGNGTLSNDSLFTNLPEVSTIVSDSLGNIFCRGFYFHEVEIADTILQAYWAGSFLFRWGSFGLNDETPIDSTITYPDVLFPNPTSGLMHVSNSDSTSKTYVLYNVLGQTVTNRRIISSQWIDLSSEPDGIYFLELSGENKSQVFKIVKRGPH